MQPVTPMDVPILIPDAPAPRQEHVALATLWARGELAARQVLLDSLTGDAEVAARTAIAAKSLAYKAGFGGVIGLEQGAARVIESVKITDEVEVKFRAPASPESRAGAAAETWDTLALRLLQGAVPIQSRPFSFPGAAR